MPRRKPDTCNEMRYEFSLGPKEQPLIKELTKTIETTNQTLGIVRIGAMVAPVAVIGVGYGVYRGLKSLGVGIMNGLAGFGFGPDTLDQIKNSVPKNWSDVYDLTGPGLVQKKAEQWAEEHAPENIQRAVEDGGMWKNAIPVFGPIRVIGKLTGKWDLW